jgi:hypothetical protein
MEVTKKLKVYVRFKFESDEADGAQLTVHNIGLQFR